MPGEGEQQHREAGQSHPRQEARDGVRNERLRSFGGRRGGHGVDLLIGGNLASLSRDDGNPFGEAL
jgi:hypothetical protein